MTYLRGGQILDIDLTKREIHKRPVESYARRVLGGRGINTMLLYEGVGPEVKPLDPENMLIFGIGPLGGTTFPSSGRTDVMSKSPSTGFLGSSNFGGCWGPELKFAGYDHVAVTGKAEKPTYIFIHDDEVEFKDAGHLWGKDTYETQRIIKEELGDPEVQIVCIGPAGENQVLVACLMHKAADAAGRTGMGAVAGSKNLKAIAVRGTKPIEVADPERFLEVSLKAHNMIKSWEGYDSISTYGVVYFLLGYCKAGVWPISNFRFYPDDAKMEKFMSDDFYKFVQDTLYKRAACFGCPLRCFDTYRIPGVGTGTASCQHYPDFSCRVNNYDWKTTVESVFLCHKYGLDTMVSGYISWLMELYDVGIITEKDTDGIPMRWGDMDAVKTMLHKIAYKEGIGELLGRGARVTAKKIGKGAEAYWMGQRDLPHYTSNQENFMDIALATAAGTRYDGHRGVQFNDLSFGETLIAVASPEEAAKGGKTLRDVSADLEESKRMEEHYKEYSKKITGVDTGYIPTVYEGKDIQCAYFEDSDAITDCLGVCKWVGPWLGGPLNSDMFTDAERDIYPEALSAGLGETIPRDMLFEIARKIRTLDRAYDVREGRNRETDTLPKRYFDRRQEAGVYKGEKGDRKKFEELKSKYYTLRGWDVENGVPSREILEKFGLAEVADDLEKRGKLSKAKVKT